MVPLAGGAYQRRFDAEIDIVDERRIFVRGRMRDQALDLEHTWLLSTPEYEVLEAGATQYAGEADHLAPELCTRYAAVEGVRIGRGFTKRILDELGEDLPGKLNHLLLAIEMARVGQQIYQFPAGFADRFDCEPDVLSAAALVSWKKDRAYLGALADSCYTYRDASAALFASRRVVSIVGPDITSPKPGTRCAFWRRKCLTIQQVEQVLAVAPSRA